MSGEVGIIVQTRMSSSRLPGKSLLKIGENPLIEYVLQRLRLTGLPVVVCTSREPSDDVLCNFLEAAGYPFFRGSLQNVLQRYIQTAEAFGFQKIIRVTGDNPLVDIQYLKESLPVFETNEYVDGIYPYGLIKGTGFEFVSLAELKTISSVEPEHLEHVTSWLRENISASNKRMSLAPGSDNKHRENLYLTCDFREDLELLQKIFEHFNFRYDIKIKDVVNFIELNPELKYINCHLHNENP